MPSDSTKPTRNASVDVLVGKAKEAISKASYAAAVELLQQAVRLAPEDQEARQLLLQTTEASRRHQAAIVRYEKGLQAARQIEMLLERGDAGEARAEHDAAKLAHGQHDALLALEERLAEQEALARQAQAAELIETARERAEAGDWHGVLEVVEQSLRLAPSGAASTLRDRAQVEIGREAERRHYRDAFEEARGDVERLIEARELPRAGQRLRQATEQLGSHETFDELSRRIDQAKTDSSFRQRVEWAERRANEAARLIAEAESLTQRHAYQEAIEHLQSARQLDPSHPEIEDRLETASEARRRQIAEQERGLALDHCLAEVKSQLDALRLDAAEETIERGLEEFGAEQRFVRLTTRLERLREVERSGQAFAASDAGAEIDVGSEGERLRHQRELAEAYSWQQTLLYPFRGAGLEVFWAVVGLLIAFDLLALVPAVGTVFDVLGLLVLLIALGWIPALVRSTVQGGNLVPTWRQLGDLRRWRRDFPRCVGLVVLAALPLLMLLATRRWHAGFSAESGPVGWLAAALLAWLGVAGIIVASGAMEAFGNAQALRLSRHPRGFAAGQMEALLAVDGLFALGLLIVVLQVALVSRVPWLGLPLVRALEVYGLLVGPHLIGVLVRRHRLELSKIYS